MTSEVNPISLPSPGNIVFSVILTRRDLRNSFNLLLVALAFFDSCYIVGAILESTRQVMTRDVQKLC